MLDKIGKRYPSVSTTTSFDEILNDASIEAVCIATPVATHQPLARAALSAGKHVFIEKPLAASTEQALDLIDLADQGELVLMPGHTFLYSPPVNTIRDLIESGELGDIYFISTSRVNLGLHQPDASVVWDLAPHDFSILRYWLGETPSHVSAISRGCVMPSTPDVARSSTSSTHQASSPMQSFRGSRRASCAGRRSLGLRRWSSTTTRATSPCASSTQA
jgi:predicted dehydrogenase